MSRWRKEVSAQKGVGVVVLSFPGRRFWILRNKQIGGLIK